MWFIKNPEWFDVVVTDNLFGDIITDLAAMIQGRMGVAAGGNNINPEGVSMFEPSLNLWVVLPLNTQDKTLLIL
jgi:3-isopropylmalate dehydrogenase